MAFSEASESFVAACLQMNGGTDLQKNLDTVAQLVAEAAAQGARYVQTPEVTTLVQKDREALFKAISPETNQKACAVFSDLAREHRLWLHIGSMAAALEEGASDSRLANRAYVFAPNGQIAATYDKIHMFDVDLDAGESYRESQYFRPGGKAVLADLTFPNRSPYADLSLRLGLAICYDLRFAALFRAYAEKGAVLLGAPAAFTCQTGAAHWHVLQRARAIENGAFMLSAAQAGRHEDGRETFGHAMIVDPWGQILAEADGTSAMVITAEIRPDLAKKARAQIPVLASSRAFDIVNGDTRVRP